VLLDGLEDDPCATGDITLFQYFTPFSNPILLRRLFDASTAFCVDVDPDVVVVTRETLPTAEQSLFLRS
jgi:hypothetical protein